MFNIKSLRLDTLETSKIITNFIDENMRKSGLNGAVIAISGGIDSALVLSLTVAALGPEKVRAVMMPERDITPEGDITDVIHLTDAYEVTCDIVEITPALESLTAILPFYDPENRLSSGIVHLSLGVRAASPAR